MKPGYSWMNSKEVKKVKQLLLENYGFEFDFSKYAFCINESNKVYMVNKEIDRFDLEVVRINSIGLYLGELGENEFRLSMEASQIIGPLAQTNVVELNDEEAAKWLRGVDLEKEGSSQGFVIIKRGKDYLGCSKHKEGILMNFTPKERRIKSVD